MKNFIRFGLVALASVTLHGCVTVKSISISQIPDSGQRKQEIKASATSPVVFSIPFNTSYIDDARPTF